MLDFTRNIEVLIQIANLRIWLHALSIVALTYVSYSVFRRSHSRNSLIVFVGMMLWLLGEIMRIPRLEIVSSAFTVVGSLSLIAGYVLVILGLLKELIRRSLVRV
jgi:hypothetical protein